MRVSIGILLLVSAASVQADSVSVNGFSCSSSNKNPFKVSAYIDNGDSRKNTASSYGDSSDDRNDTRIGVKVSYEFGSESQPLDCNKLYQLELQRLELEIKRLERLQGIDPQWAD